MIEYTSAEIRHMYRKLNPDMPSDEVLEYRYGDAITGAEEYHKSRGYRPRRNKTMAELSDAELEQLKREHLDAVGTNCIEGQYAD